MRRRSAIRLLLLACLAPIGSVPALAGGGSWQVTVESLARHGGGAAAMVLNTLVMRFAYRNCTYVTVHAVYDPGSAWQRLPAGPPMTRQDHDAALKHLEWALASRTPIFFGAMGIGLSSKPGQPCEFWSKGLDHIRQADGTWAVFSYHDWP